MKNIIIKILPPFLFQILNNLRRRILFTENVLFDGNDNLYKEHIKKCKIYGEYGVGKTTNWVLKNTNCKMICVDSSSQWINIVKSKISSDSNMKRVKFKWYDLGEIGEWGNPLSYDKHQNIPKYIESIWTENIKPDLVLIDGRFRIACFLKSLLKSEKNTKIIFDDYTNRRIYHIVEQVIKPSEIYKRQALFIKTEDLDIKLIKNLYSKFEYVIS